MMERLTEKVFGFVQLKACGNDFCKETCAEHDEEKSCKNCHIQKAFEKLAEYEDLEEQGLLLKLHCSRVYYIVDKGTKYATVMSKSIQDLCVFEIKGIGKDGYYWSTQAEAEQKLKEMENK